MRRRRQHETLGVEEGSYLVSVSDLMAGLMFVFIITLVVFAINLRDAEKKLKVTEEKKREEIRQLQGADAARRQLLERIQTQLRREGLAIEIDEDNGLLRLPEEILFQSGREEFNPGGVEHLAKLASVLDLLLPCYTASSPATAAACPQRDYEANLDALVIEGHTDDVPVMPGLRFRSNWDLSAARAIRTYGVLMNHKPGLGGFRNDRGEPLFAVAGYADARRIALGMSRDERARNRRIDLRLLMSSPRTEDLSERAP